MVLLAAHTSVVVRFAHVKRIAIAAITVLVNMEI